MESLNPEHSSPVHLERARSERVLVAFNHDEIVALQYPIIVEMWDRVAGRGAGGQRRRAYLKEFNEADRAKLSSLYRKLYLWYLVSGTPQTTVMSVRTYLFIQRAVAFFASV